MVRFRSFVSGRGNGVRKMVILVLRLVSFGIRRCLIGIVLFLMFWRISLKWIIKKFVWNCLSNRVKVEIFILVVDVWLIFCLIYLGKSIVNL